MIKTKYSGILYPNRADLLDKAFKAIFESEQSVGKLPNPNEEPKTEFKGLIVPSGNISKCGFALSYAYDSLAKLENFDVVVMFTDSKDIDNATVLLDTIETPYGFLRVDQPLVKEIIKNENIIVGNDKFLDCPGLELQYPFIQKFVENNKLIVSILISKNDDLKEIALDIKEALMELNKTAVFMCISNLTSYGREFSYVPFSIDVEEKIEEMDKTALDFIKNYDYDSYETYVHDNLCNFTGKNSISLLLRILKKNSVEILKYYTSAKMLGTDPIKGSESFATVIFN